jgi:PPOX class probable F420-dependent enzyme
VTAPTAVSGRECGGMAPNDPPAAPAGATTVKGIPMSDLDPFARLVPLDHGLCVVVTRRPDGTPHATVVNAGVTTDPTTTQPCVGFVAARGSRKLAHLRADPTISVTVRASWEWATVDGTASIIGPDDPHPDVDDEALRMLLRTTFTDAGGTHDDWDAYDRVMREERRAVVLVEPQRVYGVPRT